MTGIAEFFSDPSRSGPFYLDSNKYTSFATTFTRYLIKRTISECDLSCLATLLSKASYSIELAILLNSKLKEIHSPDLVQKAAGIVNLYRNSSESSSHSCYGALHAKDSDNSNSISDDRLVVSREESTAPSSKFSPAPRIGETNEGRHTASTLENVTIHTTQAPQNVTPTLPQPNIPALAANNLVKVPPWRAPPNDYAGPTNTVLLPTIDPTVTETVPTTLLTAPQNVTPTLAQPNIPALAANNLVKVPPWRRAPPNDYAGPTNTVLLPTIDPTVTETVPTTLLTAPQNVTPTLPQPNIPALAANNLVKVPPWRRAPPNDYAGPTNTVLLPTIDPTVTETVPTTLLTAPQNVTPTLPQPNIPALAANNLVRKVPPWRAPPNDYASPTNTVLLPTIAPTPPRICQQPCPKGTTLRAPLTPPNDYAGPTNMVLLPMPIGGFPPIRGLTDLDMRTNVDPSSLALWDEYQGTAVLAYIPYDKPEAESSPKVMKIRNLIESIFNPPGLIVSVPQYIDAGYRFKKPIYPFFIGGISKGQAQVLLDRICWSTPTITFFIAPFTPFVSDFVMTLQNVPLTGTHENELAIAEIVKNVIRTNTTLRHFFTNHHKTLPDYPTTAKAINRIADSVRATGLNTIVAGEPVTLFNIFATPPSSDAATYEYWVLKTPQYYLLLPVGKPHGERTLQLQLLQVY
ncbi:hypothetical protein BYT27DRAFT_7218575 [Phlegmacium glaucopus]|nr:hypothetical protein BYT27DRAFT_7218575 [Phlegmacium glaucopus]